MRSRQSRHDGGRRCVHGRACRLGLRRRRARCFARRGGLSRPEPLEREQNHGRERDEADHDEQDALAALFLCSGGAHRPHRTRAGCGPRAQCGGLDLSTARRSLGRRRRLFFCSFFVARLRAPGLRAIGDRGSDRGGSALAFVRGGLRLHGLVRLGPERLDGAPEGLLLLLFSVGAGELFAHNGANPRTAPGGRSRPS